MVGGLTWNPWGAVNVLAGLLLLAFGLFVVAQAPRGRANRALLVVCLAVGLGDIALGLARSATSLEDARFWMTLRVPAALLHFPALVYLALVFPRPLLDARAGRRVAAGIAALWLGLTGLFAARPELFIAQLLATRYGYVLAGGPAFAAYDFAGLAAMGAVLALTLRAARLAPGERAREQARLFAVSVAIYGAWAGGTIVVDALVERIPFVDVGAPVALAVLSYAILKYQLFGIEVQVKRGTVATVVVALGVGAYVLLARALDALLGPLGLGGAAAQALAAGLVVLAATRVRAVGTAVAEALFPRVHEGDPGYLQHRRLQVYRAALDAAQHEGPALGPEALRALRRELGVSDREHTLLVAELEGAALREGALFLGRYRVVRRLGEGAHGEVFLAHDERLGRDVVLKRLLGERLRDAAALRRFQREMRLASALHHPRIITVYDVEVLGEAAYLVMEHAPGGSLAERLRRHGPLPEDEASRLAIEVLDALMALHARGIVHRDVKPSNVLLDARGGAKLGDFGIAQDVVSGETVDGAAVGTAAGTLAYMAPEQAKGLPATPRTDLYSLAATLYEALTARPPIDVQGLGDFEARLRVVQEAPPLPIPGVSPRTNKVLALGLAKDPRERFIDAQAMAAALRGDEPQEAPGGTRTPATRSRMPRA